MSASDVVLAKSGTTALECMFAKRAMSVFYKISKLNYLFYKLLPIKKITRISMPNWLANKDIVP
jgi:lipid-A-disaccharide synthase